MRMNTDKDYYSILGVMPDAQDIVIKAAYRALAQRYHPDRAGGGSAQDNAYMAELNEAYAILSDADSRSRYDQSRNQSTPHRSSHLSAMEEQAPPGDDPLAKDWRIAVNVYPDLAQIEQRLARFSWKLSNTYRAYLLEAKQFEGRHSLAALLENDFLSTYFGDHPKTMEFARKLVLERRREAALALNNMVRVLGLNSDPNRIIGKIARDFDLRHLAADLERISPLVTRAKMSTAEVGVFVLLLKELGGSFSYDPGGSVSGRMTTDKACRAEFEGRENTFGSEYEFGLWFRREVLPVAERLMRCAA
jgi:curved DNA-binding protein CbpA